jgi:hypothetical protein
MPWKPKYRTAFKTRVTCSIDQQDYEWVTKNGKWSFSDLLAQAILSARRKERGTAEDPASIKREAEEAVAAYKASLGAK